MKLSAHEEYGLRCLLRIGLAGQDESLTIPEISQAEALSPAYAAKLLRMLRRGGFITSARGKVGGYTLSRPAGQIVIGDVIGVLGGRLFESKHFCHEHAGQIAGMHPFGGLLGALALARGAIGGGRRLEQDHAARPAAQRRRDELLGKAHAHS